MKYENPAVTVDIVVFTIQNEELKVLLVKRKIDPYKNSWAIPGGFVKIDESLEDAAVRELKEETGASGLYLEQLYTFGNIKRDPRQRVITVSYLALTNSDKIELKATTDVSDAKWFSLKSLPSLAFDHDKILKYALKRLKWKFEYTAVAFSLLPKKFTLSQLQELYEIVFNKKFDKRNFRKKLFSLNILKEEETKTDVSHRPPKLYSLKANISEIVEII
jgi:8-oxo-dGTP diphosphatase